MWRITLFFLLSIFFNFLHAEYKVEESNNWYFLKHTFKKNNGEVLELELSCKNDPNEATPCVINLKHTNPNLKTNIYIAGRRSAGMAGNSLFYYNSKSQILLKGYIKQSSFHDYPYEFIVNGGMDKLDSIFNVAINMISFYDNRRKNKIQFEVNDKFMIRDMWNAISAKINIAENQSYNYQVTGPVKYYKKGITAFYKLTKDEQVYLKIPIETGEKINVTKTMITFKSAQNKPIAERQVSFTDTYSTGAPLGLKDRCEIAGLVFSYKVTLPNLRSTRNYVFYSENDKGNKNLKTIWLFDLATGVAMNFKAKRI